MTHLLQDERLFLDWYRDEYNSGDINASNYEWASAYAQGLADAMHIDDPQRDRLQRLANILSGGAALLSVIKQYKLKAPE